MKRIDKVDLKPSHVGRTKDDAEFGGAALSYCKTHARNIIDQYCVDCDLAACGTCLLRHHRQHNLIDLDVQANVRTKELQAVLQETDVLIKLVDERIKDNKKQEAQSNDDITSVRQQIDKVIDGMITKLNNQRHQLYISLDKIQEQKEKVMMTIHDGQDFTKAAATSLKSYTDKILRHGRDYDKVQQATDIQTRLASMSKTRIPAFIWSRHDNHEASLQETPIAKVSMMTDVMATKDGERDVKGSAAGKQAVRDNVESKIPLIEQDMLPMAGLEVMGQTMWVVHYDQSSLQAYPMAPPHKPQTLLIKGLTNPRYMVRFPPGQSQLIISDLNNQLMWIKLDQRGGQWKVTSQKAMKLKYSPRGLSVHDNQLLVCDNESIHVLSTSGEEKHRVNMRQNVKPWKAVALRTSPGFVVMDSTNKQVVLVTEKVDVHQTYRGQKGFTPGDIVCQGDSIYVTDFHNHSLDELSVDGRHVRQLFREQGVSYADRLHTEDTGRLYVAQGEYMAKREVLVIETTVKQASPGDKLLTQQTKMNLSVTWFN